MTSWTDEVVETLRTAWEAGYSAAACAGEVYNKHGFAVTRNAILGKVDRLKLTKRRDQVAVQKPRRRRVTGSSVISHDERKRTPTVRSSPAFEDVEATDLPLDQSEFACTLVELRERSCRWPMGHPSSEDFRFCGADRGENPAPYCRRHAEIARGKKVRISDEERQRRVRQAQRNYLASGR
jgi:GcrA cell cycle regulator